MLYHLLYSLADDFAVFNLFRYITFRTGGAIMTALIIGFVIGPVMIKWLKKKQKEGQPIRADGPETHFKKAGTPTMGGLMILISSGISVLLWADLSNPYIWIVGSVILAFGLIGAADDYAKLTKKSHQGISGKVRLLCEFSVAFLAIAAYINFTETSIATGLSIPFLKDYLLPLGILSMPFSMLVIVGASNAVNLTDGLGWLGNCPCDDCRSLFWIDFLSSWKCFVCRLLRDSVRSGNRRAGDYLWRIDWRRHGVFMV